MLEQQSIGLDVDMDADTPRLQWIRCGWILTIVISASFALYSYAIWYGPGKSQRQHRSPLSLGIVCIFRGFFAFLCIHTFSKCRAMFRETRGSTENTNGIVRACVCECMMQMNWSPFRVNVTQLYFEIIPKKETFSTFPYSGLRFANVAASFGKFTPNRVNWSDLNRNSISYELIVSRTAVGKCSSIVFDSCMINHTRSRQKWAE